MELLVPAVVCVGRRVDEGIVEGGLAHVGPEAIDLPESRGGVEGERVGAEADDLACSSVPRC